MSGHRKWRKPEGERELELRLQMVQYVEGYILACEDVLRDLDAMETMPREINSRSFAEEIRAKVQDSRRQARQSLRLWKGLSTDEPEGVNTQTD